MKQQVPRKPEGVQNRGEITIVGVTRPKRVWEAVMQLHRGYHDSRTDLIMEIGAPAVEPLIKLVAYNASPWDNPAALVLNHDMRADAIPAAALLLNDKNPKVRGIAANAIFHIARKPGARGEAVESAFEPLLHLLEDQNPMVVRYAVYALRIVGGERAIGPLLERSGWLTDMLQGEFADDSAEALYEISRTVKDRALMGAMVQPLLRMLDRCTSSDPDENKAPFFATLALGRVGGESVAATLRGVAGSDAAELGFAREIALMRLANDIDVWRLAELHTQRIEELRHYSPYMEGWVNFAAGQELASVGVLALKPLLIALRKTRAGFFSCEKSVHHTIMDMGPAAVEKLRELAEDGVAAHEEYPEAVKLREVSRLQDLDERITCGQEAEIVLAQFKYIEETNQECIRRASQTQ